MAYILHIETATQVCSVALSKDSELIALQEDKTLQYSHSGQLTTFIEQVVKNANLELKHLNAVAVSMGPGSYTGLRIGVSTAKGICYALDIPLIAVNTPSVIARFAKTVSEYNTDYIIPMIDARRMEVYCAVFDNALNQISETTAEVIDENSFAPFLQKGKVLFCGDGSVKCASILNHPNAIFQSELHTSAAGMPVIVYEKYCNENFEDIAYFEPFYLKDFIAGKPKVKGLN
jgi:tRNA threonylcarbamoyladenosine biosynthesis protein TsaB